MLEALQFSAALRLQADVSSEQRAAFVHEVRPSWRPILSLQGLRLGLCLVR